jgi:hypothetical protein
VSLKSRDCRRDELISIFQFLRSLGINVSIVFFTASHVFRVVTLKGLDVEDIPKRTSIGSSNSFDAHVELSAVCRMSMPRVVTWLIDFRGIRADESFCYFQLIACVHQVCPNTNSLVIVIGEARRALVLGSISVPTAVEHSAVGWMGENSVEPRAVGSRNWRLCSI